MTLPTRSIALVVETREQEMVPEVGIVDGILIGETDGRSEGFFEGKIVGLMEGITDGILEGDFVGVAEGAGVLQQYP
jgi:hypothetical protein